jgi:hypothetical protein
MVVRNYETAMTLPELYLAHQAHGPARGTTWSSLLANNLRDPALLARQVRLLHE